VSLCFKRIHAIEGKKRVQSRVGHEALVVAVQEIMQIVSAIRAYHSDTTGDRKRQAEDALDETE